MTRTFFDPEIGQLARLAESLSAEMRSVPSSTGIGAPGATPAPATLARSPISTSPSTSSSSAIPFTRASTLATMKDKTQTITFGNTAKWTLQTNAFLEALVLDVALLSTETNSATVAFHADAPFNVIQRIALTDPSGESIIAPITGYHLYLLNKYLVDSECNFDPKATPHYKVITGDHTYGGSFNFRLVVPVELRRRNALGAVNNSAANQRYRLTINSVASATTLYSTKPTTPVTKWKCQITQLYWTTPPSSIKTKTGTVAAQKDPAGNGSVAFVRYERHNDVTGGGTPTFQLTNVGDYISQLIFVLRDATTTARDKYPVPHSSTSANWPITFAWWINDFQVHAKSAYGPNGKTAATASGVGRGGTWPRTMARFYGYVYTYTTARGLDNGVYTLTEMVGLLDEATNFGTSNQYLPTDSTTKLQVRGSTFGSGSKFFEVLVRIIRPVSGAALYS